MERIPVIGLLVSALLEDEWNKGGDTRPAAETSITRIVERLSKLGRVVRTRLVENISDAGIARDAFIDQRVDVVLVMQLSYAQGVIALRALRGITAPLIVWNTQFMESIPHDSAWETLLVNSGVTGVTEITSALVRTGRKFSFINGAFDFPEPWAELAGLVAAASVKRQLDGARIGMIGHPYQWMSDLMVDPLEVMDRFGIVLEYIEDGELIAAVERQGGSAESVSYLDSLHSRVAVRGMDKAAMRRSAEYALAVAGIVEGRGLSALSFYEQGLLLHPSIGLSGALAMCELFSRGVPCTSEADLLTLVLMLAMKHLAGESTFLEHYGMDFNRNSLLMAHDSFGNWELADKSDGIVLEPTIFYQGMAGSGAAARFRYRPGEVTLGSLTVGPPGMAERFRLIVSEGESQPFKARPIPAPQMEFLPDLKDVNGFYKSYCRLGGGHHMAGCYGRVGKVLEALADFWGIDFHLL